LLKLKKKSRSLLKQRGAVAPLDLFGVKIVNRNILWDPLLNSDLRIKPAKICHK